MMDAIAEACRAIGVVPPAHTTPGKWVKCPVVGKAKSNRSGRVFVFDDESGGIAWNWVTGLQQRFKRDGLAGPGEIKAPRRNTEQERLAAQARLEAESICEAIVAACDRTEHPYLAAKGFPSEIGLVHTDPRPLMRPDMARALGDAEGPFLIVPGRIGRRITTVQFISPDGTKLNAKGATMAGAAHRIASGREIWVAEGIATALTVRAALRLLNRSATVYSAFAANNVAHVAERFAGSIIAADHDKPLPQLHDLGTGEFYARRTGRAFTMPPSLGDFNDMMQSDGLRAVALRLNEIKPGGL